MGISDGPLSQFQVDLVCSRANLQLVFAWSLNVKVLINWYLQQGLLFTNILITTASFRWHFYQERLQGSPGRAGRVQFREDDSHWKKLSSKVCWRPGNSIQKGWRVDVVILWHFICILLQGSYKINALKMQYELVFLTQRLDVKLRSLKFEEKVCKVCMKMFYCLTIYFRKKKAYWKRSPGLGKQFPNWK